MEEVVDGLKTISQNVFNLKGFAIFQDSAKTEMSRTHASKKFDSCQNLSQICYNIWQSLFGS